MFAIKMVKNFSRPGGDEMAGLIIPEKDSHWYYDNGQPCYNVPKKTKPGELRPPNAVDALELGLWPGGSSFNSMLYKPALESWKMEQAVLSALTLPRQEPESLDNFARRVVRDAQVEGQRAADFGTTVHALAESYLGGKIPDALSTVEMSFLEGFMDWCQHHEISVLALEKTFASPEIGCGGRVDCIAYITCREWGVRCSCITPLDGLYVIDWKTQKDYIGSDKRSLMPMKFYPEWNFQLSFYQRGLGMQEGSKKLSVCISSTTPGRVQAQVWDSEDDWGWRGAQALRTLWYGPAGPGFKIAQARGLEF